MRGSRGLIGFLFLVALAMAQSAWAQVGSDGERITDYDDAVVIKPDATVLVTETIDVIANGSQIKHGIYRDFPRLYQDAKGNSIEVGFHVINVWRDGQPITFHTQSNGNNDRVMMGDANVVVPPGSHTYVLQYQTDHQIGYFKDFDELYWNVTGNGWVFPIDHVRATITLPPQGTVTQQSAYTGLAGATGRDYQTEQNPDGTISFVTTRQLQPHEGLTIAVAWPKNLVSGPSTDFRLGNKALMQKVGIDLFILLIVYYLIIWFLFGRGPRKGPIIPLFAPPAGFSPGAVGHIYRKYGRGDNWAFSATLVNMAVKGCLKIVQTEKGFFSKGYKLQKIGSPETLAPEEQLVADCLFAESSEITLGRSNPLFPSSSAAVLTATFSDYEADLVARYDVGLYAYNLRYGIVGLLLSLLILFVSFSAFRPVIPFVFVGLFGINLAFAKALKAPTIEGRKILDQIEGFKMYLATAEKERLNAFMPPKMTPDIFEKCLPYAIALGVQNNWGKQFEAVVISGLFTDYSPAWYAGNAWNINQVAGFTSGFADTFTSSVQASAVPPSAAPGSSIGSDGGGSSGDGGGGGGGGGF